MDTWKILIISDKESQSYWKAMASKISEKIGPAGIFQKSEVSREIMEYPPGLVLLDISKIDELHHMITEIHQKQPDTSIVVVTSAPTWKRTREVLQLGATSLIRKSINQDEILNDLLNI